MTEPTVIAPLERADEPEPAPLRARRKRENLDFALPTINVIFLLMLYFLIAGTIVQKNELSVTPPETIKIPANRLPRPLLVIAETGQLMLDGQVVGPSDLIAASIETLTDPASPADHLNVLAPANMPAQPFLDILAAFSAANVPVRVVAVEAEEVAGP